MNEASIPGASKIPATPDSPARTGGPTLTQEQMEAISAQCRAIDGHAVRLAQESGLTFRVECGPDLTAKMAERYDKPYRCTLVLARHRERWGIYFLRETDGSDEARIAPIDASPLEVRAWLLEHAGEIFRAYQERCEAVFEERRRALETGAAALASLEAFGRKWGL